MSGNGCGDCTPDGNGPCTSGCTPAAPVVQGADEESINLTPGVVWTHAQLDVIRDLLVRNARLLAERDQAQAAVQRVRELAGNRPWPSVIAGTDVVFLADLLAALDGARG